MSPATRTRPVIFRIAVAFVLLLAHAQASTQEGTAAQGSDETGQTAFPVLIVQISNIDPSGMALAETTIAGYSGHRSRWAKSALNQFMKLPSNLTVELPRKRGLAYFWNPVAPEGPQMAEFWELLPQDVVDLTKTPEQGSQPGDGEYETVQMGTDRWALNYYATTPDGRKWTRVSPAIYSYYFAKNGQSLWKSVSPQLLNATLPELRDPDSQFPAIDLWLQMEHVPSELREQWRNAASIALASAKQQRDDETAAAFRFRLAGQQTSSQILDALTSEDTDVLGHAEVRDGGSMSAVIRIRNAELTRKVSALITGADRLSAVKTHSPWFHAWLGFRLPEQLREELRLLCDAIDQQPHGAASDWHPLLQHWSQCEEFQLTVAGISAPDGTPTLVLGVATEDAESLVDWMTAQTNKLAGLVQLGHDVPKLTSAGDHSVFWLVMGSDDSRDTAASLLEKSKSLPPNPTRSLIEVRINTAQLPERRNLSSDSSEVDNDGTLQSILHRALPLLANVQEVIASKNPSDSELSCSLLFEPDFVQLSAASGQTVTIGLAAVLGRELDALRVRSRPQRR